MRRADEVDAFACDREGSAGHSEADDGGGDGFCFAVAVGMGFVGRAERDAEADVDDSGAEDVGEGFDAIGDQSEGMAEEAGGALTKGEKKIGNDAEQRRMESPMYVEFWIGDIAHANRPKARFYAGDCEQG
jgi:hypothetical protein